jgi:predicted peptidase
MIYRHGLRHGGLLVTLGFAGLGAGCSAPSHAGPGRSDDKPMPQTGFIERSLQMPDGRQRRYAIFVPRSYDASKAWPAILFLHGAGERGDDNQAQVRVGIGKAIRRQQADFGFITIMPQCAKDTWWTDDSEKSYAMAALARTRKEYSIDPARIILTGLSMGGQLTWVLAAEHPDLWAAIVPICGAKGDPARAAAFAQVQCWCFHGTKDDVVPVARSREMVQAIKKAGGHPRYTEYPNANHNSWDAAYETDELFTWMASQRHK